MNVRDLTQCFKDLHYEVCVLKFSEIDYTADYHGCYILYQTSEASGAFYKHFIEDIVYELQERGAVLLPEFRYLKAHHNKVYMEILRSSFKDDMLKTITSRVCGNPDEALKNISGFPTVIKRTAGSGSNGVFLAHNHKEYKKLIRKASLVGFSENHSWIKDWTKNSIKKCINCVKKEKYKIELPCYNSFIIQNFIPGLSGDFKVLYFGGKYFTLYRKNRNNDFRASGSGKLFEVKEQEHIGLLDFARKITKEIDFPILGLDIGYDGLQYHLIEFQMLHIGPYTLQASRFWHEYQDGIWIRKEGSSDLEQEFARSIDFFIRTKSN